MATSPAYSAIGNRLLKVAVILLCCVNALMWEYYTESRMMAIMWAGIAVAFVLWIVDDLRR
jgi:membrane protein YdbS with pleckstrin-like domain